MPELDEFKPVNNPTGQQGASTAVAEPVPASPWDAVPLIDEPVIASATASVPVSPWDAFPLVAEPPPMQPQPDPNAPTHMGYVGQQPQGDPQQQIEPTPLEDPGWQRMGWQGENELDIQLDQFRKFPGQRHELTMVPGDTRDPQSRWISQGTGTEQMDNNAAIETIGNIIKSQGWDTKKWDTKAWENIQEAMAVLDDEDVFATAKSTPITEFLKHLPRNMEERAAKEDRQVAAEQQQAESILQAKAFAQYQKDVPDLVKAMRKKEETSKKRNLAMVAYAPTTVPTLGSLEIYEYFKGSPIENYMKENVPEENYDDFVSALNAHSQSLPDKERGFVSNIATALSRGQESVKANLGAMAMKTVQGADAEARDRRIKNATRLIESHDELKSKKRTGFHASALSFVEDKIAIPFAEMVPAMYSGGAISAATGGMAAPGIGATLAAGGGGTAFWYAQEYPDLKDQIIEDGGSEEMATVAAGVGALSIASIEFLQVSRAAKGAARLAGFRAAKEATKQVWRQTYRKAIAAGTAKAGVNLTAEVSQEIAQSALSLATRRAAAELGDYNDQIDWAAELENEKQGLIRAAGGMVPMALIAGGGRMRRPRITTFVDNASRKNAALLPADVKAEAEAKGLDLTKGDDRKKYAKKLSETMQLGDAMEQTIAQNKQLKKEIQDEAQDDAQVRDETEVSQDETEAETETPEVQVGREESEEAGEYPIEVGTINRGKGVEDAFVYKQADGTFDVHDPSAEVKDDQYRVDVGDPTKLEGYVESPVEAAEPVEEAVTEATPDGTASTISDHLEAVVGAFAQPNQPTSPLGPVSVGDTVDVAWAGNPREADADTRVSGTAQVIAVSKDGKQIRVKITDDMVSQLPDQHGGETPTEFVYNTETGIATSDFTIGWTGVVGRQQAAAEQQATEAAPTRDEMTAATATGKPRRWQPYSDEQIKAEITRVEGEAKRGEADTESAMGKWNIVDWKRQIAELREELDFRNKQKPASAPATTKPKQAAKPAPDVPTTQDDVQGQVDAKIDEIRVDELFDKRWGTKTGNKRADAQRMETIRKEVAEEEAAAKEYPPGTQLEIEGYKGTTFTVVSAADNAPATLQDQAGRPMGDNAGAVLRQYTPEQITVTFEMGAEGQRLGEQGQIPIVKEPAGVSDTGVPQESLKSKAAPALATEGKAQPAATIAETQAEAEVAPDYSHLKNNKQREAELTRRGVTGHGGKKKAELLRLLAESEPESTETQAEATPDSRAELDAKTVLQLKKLAPKGKQGRRKAGLIDAILEAEQKAEQKTKRAKRAKAAKKAAAEAQPTKPADAATQAADRTKQFLSGSSIEDLQEIADELELDIKGTDRKAIIAELSSNQDVRDYAEGLAREAVADQAVSEQDSGKPASSESIPDAMQADKGQPEAREVEPTTAVEKQQAKIAGKIGFDLRLVEGGQPSVVAWWDPDTKTVWFNRAGLRKAVTDGKKRKKSPESVMWGIFAHEAFHAMRVSDPKAWNKFARWLVQHDRKQKALDPNYKGLEDARDGYLGDLKTAHAEATGETKAGLAKLIKQWNSKSKAGAALRSDEAVSRYLEDHAGDFDFWNKLGKEEPGLLKRMWQAIQKFFADSEPDTLAGQARQAIESAMTENGIKATGPKRRGRRSGKRAAVGKDSRSINGEVSVVTTEWADGPTTMRVETPDGKPITRLHYSQMSEQTRDELSRLGAEWTPESLWGEELLELTKGRTSDGTGKRAAVGKINVDDVRAHDRSGSRIAKGLSVRTVKGEKVFTDNDDLSLDYVKETAPQLFIKNANIIAKYPLIAGDNFGEATTVEEAQEIYDVFVRAAADNLLYIYEAYNPEFREISTLWYDGANSIAHDFAKRFNVTPEQAAGIIASMSPQKDWYQNVRVAELVLEAFATNPTMTQEMVAHQRGVVLPASLVGYEKDVRKTEKAYKKSRSKGRKAALDTAKAKLENRRQEQDALLEELEQYMGQSMNSVPENIQAMMARLHHEVNTTKDYNVIAPDGSVTGVARNDNGDKARLAWGSYSEIRRAVAIRNNGIPENISRSLGVQHKVRNFFNNIIDPMNPDGGVTMDTHAIAAALLQPFSGKDAPVKHNFGKGGVASSRASGISGVYFAFAEAYNLAAEEAGILPRQMQSATWDAVRGLFPNVFKSQKQNVRHAAGIWEQYQNGDITIEEARGRVFDAAGGINDPTWANGGDVREGVQEGSRTGTDRARDRATGQGMVGPSSGGRAAVGRQGLTQIRGSFDDQHRELNPSRYIVGSTIERPDFKPTAGDLRGAFAGVWQKLIDNAAVLIAKANPTLGRYSYFDKGELVKVDERSMDLEFTVRPEFDPADVLAEVARVAQEANQDAVVVSRVLNDASESENARPGVELGFSRPATEKEVKEIIAQVNETVPEAGFTFVTGPFDTGTEMPTQFIGLRFQYVPEFDSADRTAEMTGVLQDLAGELRESFQDLVLSAQSNYYESTVLNKGNYDAYRAGATEARLDRDGEEGQGRQLDGEAATDADRGVRGVPEPDSGATVPGEPGDGTRAAVGRRPGSRTDFGGSRNRRGVRTGQAQTNDAAQKVTASAEDYLEDNRERLGIEEFPPHDLVNLDETRSRTIGQQFEDAPDTELNKPEVRAAYEQLAEEVLSQYQHIVANDGMTFTYGNDGYNNSEAMMADVADNSHMQVYQTSPDSFGSKEVSADHPLLEGTGIFQGDYELVYNDLFRAVHDYYGHVADGNQFGGVGEERAWAKHVTMFSPEARRAMTSETRGQNSWVNYGPQMFDKDGWRGDKDHPRYILAEDRPFAVQKVFLLPDDVSTPKFEGGRAAVGRAAIAKGSKLDGLREHLRKVKAERKQKEKKPTVKPVPKPAKAKVPDKPPEPPAAKPPEAEGEKLNRDPFVGIKKVRLDAQTESLGLPPLTETEKVSAVELVTDAVANLTEKSDIEIQTMAKKVVMEQYTMSVEEVADLSASVDYHKRKADGATDLGNEYAASEDTDNANKQYEEADRHKEILKTLHQAAKNVGRRQFAAIGHVLQAIVDKDGEAHIEKDLLRANKGQREYDAEGNDVTAGKAKDIAKRLEASKRKQAVEEKKVDQKESASTAEERIKQLEAELKSHRTRSRKSRGSKNRRVTEEAKDAALQRIRDRRNQRKAKGGRAAVGRQEASTGRFPIVSSLSQFETANSVPQEGEVVYQRDGDRVTEYRVMHRRSSDSPDTITVANRSGRYTTAPYTDFERLVDGGGRAAVGRRAEAPDKDFSGTKVATAEGQPKKVHHGTRAEFDRFVVGGENSLFGKGISFTSDAAEAERYSSVDPSVNLDFTGQVEKLSQELGIPYAEAKKSIVTSAKSGVVDAYVNLQNPMVVDANGKIKVDERVFALAAAEADVTLPSNAHAKFMEKENTKDQVEYLIQHNATQMVGRIASVKNHDGLILRSNMAPKSKGGEHYIAFDPRQVQIVSRKDTSPDYRNYFTKEAIDKAEKESGSFKSREMLVYMTPDEFLQMAETLDEPTSSKQETVRGVLSQGKKLSSIPLLSFDNDGKGTASVVGHEGRHRAMELKARGVTRFPVMIKSGGSESIRWSEQSDPNSYDRIRGEWPKTLKGETSGSMPFPVSDPLAQDLGSEGGRAAVGRRAAVGKDTEADADLRADVADAAIVAGYVMESGSRKSEDFLKDMVAELGDWVRPHLKELYRTARAESAKVRQGKIKERLADSDDVKEQYGAVGEMAKEILAETRKKDGKFISREDLIDLLHKELKEADPDITWNDAQDMLAGYGEWTTLSQDDLDVKYRDYKGESREQSKQHDMQQQITPKPSGGERHTPSKAEQEMARVTNEMKKEAEREGWWNAEGGEARLKSTREAIKTRLNNEIRNLDKQIKDRGKTVKNRTAALTDVEIESLREQRNQRKERLNAIVRASKEAEAARWDDDGGHFVDPAIEAYIKVLDGQIKALKKQLVNKDVFPKLELTHPDGSRVDARKAEIEALKAEKDLMRKTLDPNFETNRKLLAAEKAAEKQVAKLEAERAAGFKMKEKPAKTRLESAKLAKARKQLDALRAQRAEALEDEYALRASIAQSKRNAANITARIASGDFAPRKRKTAQVFDDPAWQEAKLEEMAVREEFAEMQAEYEMNNETGWQTVGRWGSTAATIHKGLMTTWDMGAHGIQLGPTMYKHPIVWARSLIPTVKSLSTRQRKLQDAKREADPDYQEAVGYGVLLGEEARKRFFGNSDWIQKIPGLAMGERTFSTAMNEVRFNLWKVMKWAYTNDGWMFNGREMTQEQGEAIARQVNVWTLGYKPPKDATMRQAAMKVASIPLWATGMYVARAQIMTGGPVFFMGGDSKVRTMAAIGYVKTFVGMWALTAVLQMLLGDDEEREFLPDDDEDTLNPTDSDFWGKVVTDNNHMDMSSGLGQQAALQFRLLNSAWSARSGDQIWETRELGAREHLAGFGKYKLNPWAQAILDLSSKKDVVHRPTSVANILVSNMTPLSVQTAVEAHENSETELEAMGWTAASFMGRNVNIYDKGAPPTEETFLSTVQKVGRQMSGEKPPGLTPDELEKWLGAKVEWDTDLSGASKYLNEDQMEMARERREERKQTLLYNAIVEPDPKSKTYEESLEKREKARKTLNDTGWSHEESQKLLFNHYKGKRAKPTKYWSKFKELAGLYGKGKTDGTDPARNELLGADRSEVTDFELWMAKRYVELAEDAVDELSAADSPNARKLEAARRKVVRRKTAQEKLARKKAAQEN